MQTLLDLDRRVADFVDALVARDLESIRGLVARLRDDGVSIETLYTELFAPSLHRIGELWETGAISVAEEHVASSLVAQLMAGMYPELFVAPRASRERVLVAAPEGERHVIGLRMVADILEGRGFDVVFLGADTPRTEFAHALRRYTPQLVVLAAYTAPSAVELAAAARLLLESSPGLFVIAGGAEDAIRQAGGEHERLELVEKIAGALPAVEQAVARPAS